MAYHVLAVEATWSKLDYSFINLPFKPEGHPDSVQVREPERVNILTALAENEGVVKTASFGEQRAIALARLLHLVF